MAFHKTHFIYVQTYTVWITAAFKVWCLFAPVPCACAQSVWWDPAPKLHTCSNSPSPAYEADGSKMGSLRPLTTQSPAPSLKQRPENMPWTWVKVQARMMRSNVKFSGRQRRLPPSYLPPFSPERLTQFSIPSEIVVLWIFASRKAVYSRGSPSCNSTHPLLLRGMKFLLPSEWAGALARPLK